MANSEEPTCRCGKVMTRSNSTLAPEFFLCDECAQKEGWGRATSTPWRSCFDFPEKDGEYLIWDKFTNSRDVGTFYRDPRDKNVGHWHPTGARYWAPLLEPPTLEQQSSKNQQD